MSSSSSSSGETGPTGWVEEQWRGIERVIMLCGRSVDADDGEQWDEGRRRRWMNVRRMVEMIRVVRVA
jgi:hypothetical protein